MKRMHGFKLLVAIVLLTAGFAQEPQRAKPIALDRFVGGDLWALDASGRLLRLQVSGQTINKQNEFQLQYASSPTDLTSVKVFGQPTIFVASNSQTGGLLSQHSENGRLQASWSSRGRITGVDFDSDSQVLYFAVYERPEIYQVKLQPPGAPRAPLSRPRNDVALSGSVFGARHLGPLVFDAKRKCVYTADLDTGALYQYDVETRNAREIADGFSSPEALMVSTDSNHLYVADVLQKKIYDLDLRRLDMKVKISPRVFSNDSHFRSPMGLARLDDGGVAVADSDAGAIFILSVNGKLQSVFLFGELSQSKNLTTDKH